MVPSAEDDEIYKFVDGLFFAHARQVCQELWYSTTSIQKKLPSDSLAIEVREEATGIVRLTKNPTASATWTKITDWAEQEAWLIRRNKKHLHQVHDSKSPITQSPLKELFGPYGTTNQIADLLEGKYPVDSLDVTDLAKEWLKWMEMTDDRGRTDKNEVPRKIIFFASTSSK